MRLVEDAEMLADVGDYDAVVQAIAEGEELVPAEVVYALLDGGNPIRVWREYRGLSMPVLSLRSPHPFSASLPRVTIAPYAQPSHH